MDTVLRRIGSLFVEVDIRRVETSELLETVAGLYLKSDGKFG